MQIFEGILPSIAPPVQLAVSTFLAGVTFTSYFLHLIGKAKRSFFPEFLIAILASFTWALSLMSALVALGVHF